MSTQQKLELLECMEYFFARKAAALILRSTRSSLENSQKAKLDRLYAELTKPQKKKLLKCRQSEFWKEHQLDMYLTYTARKLASIHPHLMDTRTRSHNTSQLDKYKSQKSYRKWADANELPSEINPTFLYAERRRNLPPDTVSYIDLIFRNWAQELGPLVVKKQQVAQAAEQLAERRAIETGNSQMGFRMRKSRKSSRKRKSSKRKASRKRSRKRRSAKRKTSRKRRSAKRKTSRKRRSVKRKASRKRSRKRRSSKRCPVGCVKKKSAKRSLVKKSRSRKRKPSFFEVIPLKDHYNNVYMKSSDITKYIKDTNKITGDILFVGSDYESRPEYGIFVVDLKHKGKFINTGQEFYHVLSNADSNKEIIQELSNRDKNAVKKLIKWYSRVKKLKFKLGYSGLRGTPSGN
jgi:hypothetical protein